MKKPSSKPEGTGSPPPQANRNGNQEAFRQLLRQADKLIKEGNFDEASARIAEARELDPTNPFILAFEDRLKIFKSKSSTQSSPVPLPSKNESSAAPVPENKPQPASVEITREMIEHEVRQQIEAEYKERFTQELRKAEEHAAKLVKDERANIELHREALRTKFEHQITEVKDQLERDYQRKLSAAKEQNEAVLEKQYQESLANARQELAAKLSVTHQAEQQHLQDQIQREKTELETRERSALAERERLLREEFEIRMAEALKASEDSLRAEGEAKQLVSVKEIETKLTAEFDARLAEEVSRWKNQIETEKADLLRAQEDQRRNLVEAHNAAIGEQEQKFHERESEIRAGLQRQMDEQLRQTRDGIQGESERTHRAEIEQQEKRLSAEFDARLASEQQKWKQELESQRRKLEASHEAERQNLAEVHRKELETQAKHQADVEETRKHLSAEFEGRLAMDRERLAREYESQITELKQAHAEEQGKLAESRTKDLDLAKQAFQEKERSLRSDMERQSSEALKRMSEDVRGESDRKHRAELEQVRQKLTSDFEGRLSQEREKLLREYEAQKKNLERLHTENDKKNAAEHQKEIKKLEQEFLKKEKAEIQSREDALRKEFEIQMTNTLHKTKESMRDEGDKRHRMEVQDVRKSMTAEFESRLSSEREKLKREFSVEKQTLDQVFTAKQAALQQAHKQALEDQEKAIRSSMETGFHLQQEALRKQLEADLRIKYQSEVESERQKMEQAAAATLESEKEKLQKSYHELLEAQENTIRTIRSAIQKEMEESYLSRMEQFEKEYDYKMELIGTKVPVKIEEKYTLYRKKMLEVYRDGEPTVGAAKDILALKEVLDLSFDEHLAIESDVRLELYADEVERMIIGNEINLRDTSALSALKDKFRITLEESAKLEPYILSTIERLAVKGRVLVADDDILLVQVLEELLTKAGYQVIPAISVNDALELLSTTDVDVIVSDIKFDENELDGFKFFTEVQSQPLLSKIPFIFMSSLRDGLIIRSGVQLGVDDYLTKPIEPDLLIAVIEGKLKRYKTFEKSGKQQTWKSLPNNEALQRGINNERQPWA